MRWLGEAIADKTIIGWGVGKYVYRYSPPTTVCLGMVTRIDEFGMHFYPMQQPDLLHGLTKVDTVAIHMPFSEEDGNSIFFLDPSERRKLYLELQKIVRNEEQKLVVSSILKTPPKHRTRTRGLMFGEDT